MKKKIFASTFLVGISVLLLSAVLFFAVVYNLTEEQTFSQLATEADCVAAAMRLAGKDCLPDITAGDRITWVGSDGAVLFDNAAEPSAMENHLGREEIAEALVSGTGKSTHFSETLMQRTLYFAVRLDDGTVLRVSCTQETIASMLLRMTMPTLAITAALAVLSGILSYTLARQITKPLDSIDLDAPKPDKTYRELDPLILRLQEQNRTIRKQLSELSEKQRDFAAITDNMSEGFLLVDPKLNLLSCNRTARRIFSADEQGELKIKSGGNPVLRQALSTALAGERAEEIAGIGGISYQIIATPVVTSGQVTGSVAVILDVTEREQREALRREFSANVSHELKTPLTSISGFAELMKDGLVPPDKMKEFAGDIYRESSRLIGLVSDIINLSKLDENSGQLETEEIDLYELSETVLSELEPAAAKRGVTLRIEGTHETYRGVRQIIAEMIYNLCDNAVKYNRENGIVTVSADRDGSAPRVTVTDTGIGIPYADQGRVFERFYRVDKSHSREIGGTGLGLSIVKHGAQYHNARISLTSEPGKGTSVSITF